MAAPTRVAFRFAFIIPMFSIAAMSSLSAPQLVAPSNMGTSTPIVTPSSTERPLPYAQPGDANRPGVTGNDDESVTDLYGNDVTAAVARYKLDATGSLYEAHSPQTQLAKLGSPKS